MRVATLFVWVGLLLLSGCVTLAPNQPMDAAYREKIKTIGLFSMPAATQYRASAGKNARYTLGFGLIGGLIADGMADRHSETLDKLLRDNGFDYSVGMQHALTTELERAGFKVVLIPAVRPDNKEFVEDFSAVAAYQVDAILDTRGSAGYFDAIDDAFSPSVGMQTKLISWPARTTLYSESIAYFPGKPFFSETRLPVPGTYLVTGFDAVVSNPSRTVQGLDYGIASVASHIVQQLSGAKHAINIGSFARQSPAAEKARVNAVGDSNGNPSNTQALGTQMAQTKADQPKFGKYSYTIEKMAKTNGCQGGTGAYLTTDAGPIEGYRIDCEGGAIYLARCEYGKCGQQ